MSRAHDLPYEVLYVSGEQRMDAGNVDLFDDNDEYLTEQETYRRLLRPDEWISTKFVEMSKYFGCLTENLFDS